MSRLTQLLLFSAAASQIAGVALASDKINRATEEHQQSRSQLKEAHQELFGKMDRYFEAVSSPTPDPSKIAAAKKEMGEADQKINGIIGAANDRMNTLIQSMTYSFKDGLQEKTAEDHEPGEPLPASQVSSFVAKTPPADEDSESASGKAAAAGNEMGFPAGGRPSPRPSPSPQPSQLSSPEIRDAQAPRELVFKKRGSTPSSSEAVPSPTPTLLPSSN